MKLNYQKQPKSQDIYTNETSQNHALYPPNETSLSSIWDKRIQGYQEKETQD